MVYGRVCGLFWGVAMMGVWGGHRDAARDGWVPVYTIAADRYAALAMAY